MLAEVFLREPHVHALLDRSVYSKSFGSGLWLHCNALPREPSQVFSQCDLMFENLAVSQAVLVSVFYIRNSC